VKREEKRIKKKKKKEKNITRGKIPYLTQDPKISHNKPLVCQQQAGSGGKVSHYQVNVEDKGKSGK